jgi:hypothetical protein
MTFINALTLSFAPAPAAFVGLRYRYDVSHHRIDTREIELCWPEHGQSLDIQILFVWVVTVESHKIARRTRQYSLEIL